MARELNHTPFVLSVILFTIQAAGGTAPAGAAQGPPCGRRAAILEQLAESHRERPAGSGIASNGGLVELLASEDGRTWTLIVTRPSGRSCVLGHGRHWRGSPTPPGARET